jgi:hypothetical protein
MALVTDRVPGMQPRTPLEELFPGQREAEITPMTTIKVGDVQPGAYGVPSRPVLVKNPAPDKRVWRHVFLIPDDASTDDLIDAIETRRGAPPELGLVAALPGMLEHDRTRTGWSVEQAARRLGISVREYRELEAGARPPSFDTWDRICELYGWPQTFTRAS